MGSAKSLSINTLSIPIWAAAAACCFLVFPTSHRLEAQPSSQKALATRIEGVVPRIDGRMDDAAWKQAPVIDDFTQQRPNEGSKPTERTEIRLLYDDGALYVGARMYRTDPSKISRTVTRRDGMGNAERLVITLDTQLDRRTGIGFGISAAGVMSDFRHTRDDDMGGRESQYDPVWVGRATVDSAGWTAEMRIPFNQLRFPAAASQVWGLQLDRWMSDKNEDVQWALIPTRETGYISRFGTLEGLEGVVSTRPVELTPYIAGDATRRAGINAADPFNTPFQGRGGVDVKVGLGSNLTLDASINPDFGQVEADPAEVNLSGFETFFEERRPFFTEGSELLRGQGSQHFYSRRIGAPPHASASGDFVQTPRASTILGSAKVTGRTASRLSIGSLLAVTAAEYARTFDTTSTQHGRVAVEPRTGYGLLRLQQELGSQASTIGMSATLVRRDVSSLGGIDTLLAREAYFIGTDWRLRFQQGKYAISGWFGVSHIAGDSMAIARVQRAPARFFQRPDIDHVTYDPSRRTMSGYTASLRADKDAGRRILWGAQVLMESPGYEVNDFGRLQSTDDVEYNADIQIRETFPSRYLRNWRLGFDTRGAFNYDGQHQENNWNQNTGLTFLNFWNFNLRTSFSFPGLSDALTRGGPYMRGIGGFRQDARLNSAFGSKTFWRVSAGYGQDKLGSFSWNTGASLTLRPAPRWQVSVEPNYSNGVESRQYVTSLAGGSRTFGTRYIFAFTDRTQLSTRLRLNYAFSPFLTLEGYAEPFIASGRFFNYGELDAPRSSVLRTYGSDGTTLSRDSSGKATIRDGTDSFTLSNRDFNVRSFRSNMVLRWEWNPGSTLFLVWQQNRRTTDSNGHHIRLGDLFQTTRAAGDNFLSLKMTYWLPVGG